MVFFFIAFLVPLMSCVVLRVRMNIGVNDRNDKKVTVVTIIASVTNINRYFALVNLEVTSKKKLENTRPP